MLARTSSAHVQPPPDVSDGGSSSLSELGDIPEDQQELEPDFGSAHGLTSPRDNDIDTEASTERVDPSPMKQRDLSNYDPIGLDQLADAAAVEQLQEAVAKDNITQDLEAPVNDTLQPTVEDAELSMDEAQGGERLATAGKRKRSSSLSDLEEDDMIDEAAPARKRSASARATDHKLLDHLDPSLTHPGSIIEEPEQIEIEPPEISDVDDPPPDAPSELSDDHEADPVVPQEDVENAEEGPTSDQTPPPDEAERPPEIEIEVDADADPEPEAEPGDGARPPDEVEADAVARNEDELVKKRAAMDDLKPIENLFAIFRDKLFDDRLEQLSQEIESLRQPDCVHPEFLAKKTAIDARRDQKINFANTEFRYKSGALERKSIAERAIIHSQFAQEMRQTREDHLDKMNTYMCQLQRERRQGRAKEDHYLYQFNPKRAVQIANQRAYNKEVSLLSGLARYEGFPAAPSLAGARQTDVDEDLKRMKVSRPPISEASRINGARNTNEPQASRVHSLSYAAQIVSDEMVGEANFLEKNPWARQIPMAQLKASPGVVPEASMATPRPSAQWGPGVNGANVQQSSPLGAQASGAALQKFPSGTSNGSLDMQSRANDTTLAQEYLEVQSQYKQQGHGKVSPIPTANGISQSPEQAKGLLDHTQKQVDVENGLANGSMQAKHITTLSNQPSSNHEPQPHHHRSDDNRPHTAHTPFPNSGPDHTTQFSPPPRMVQAASTS